MLSTQPPLATTLLAALLLTISFSSTMAQPDRLTDKTFTTRSEVIAQNGMVATSQPLAAQVGLQILKKGGSAVDAAIATNAALGLMEPTGSGIGGDLFAIVWDASEKKLYGINASGRSPRNLTYEKMQEELEERGRENIPPYGFLPITVPGAVDGWFELHERFGELPMDQILAPSINYARQGFPVSPLIAFYWRIGLRIHSDRPGAFGETFSIDGEGPQKGDIFQNPDLANTYQLLAQNGRSAFYEGEIAEQIDKFMRKNGGYLRKEDFEKHRSTWVDPVSVNYRGYEVYELPPNGQGIAALQMLQMLEEYDLSSMGPRSVDALHRMIEVKKQVFEDRAKFYADPAFSDIPIQKLISKSYARKRLEEIDTSRAARRVRSGADVLEDGDTVYLTTADDEGNMVSLIQSNYRGMGSGIVVPDLGFGFQDRGELFSMDTAHANRYEAGKRPFHTIIPAFVMKNDRPYMTLGVMGGAMQPQGHVQILTDIIDFGMNLQEAGDAARWRHSGSTSPTDEQDAFLHNGGTVNMESGIPYQTIRDLMLMGHDVQYSVGGYGGYQAIRYDPERDIYIGASESRKDGHAIGY